MSDCDRSSHRHLGHHGGVPGRRPRSKQPDVVVARAYDLRDAGPDATAGRWVVLVDRLWPRGVAKEAVALDEWLKDVAPSTDLRRWYGHDPDRFAEFTRRYRDELRAAPAAEAVEHLREVARERPVTLVTATRDVERSGAEVLRRHLLDVAG